MIEAELFSHLVSEVQSVSGRVYPLVMPQGCEKPALVYTVIFDGDDQAIDGCVVSNNTRFQIDIYATSYMESVELKHEVKAALYAFEYYPQAIYSQDLYEDDESLFRQIMDFSLSIPN